MTEKKRDQTTPVRQKTIFRDGMTTTLTYNDANEVLTETYTGSGLLARLSVTNGYDAFLRRTKLALLKTSPSVQVLSYADYGYDSKSRWPQTVSDGVNNATYEYLDNSPLVDTVTFSQNTTEQMHTTRAGQICGLLYD
jgi:hypothetical protein